MILSSLTGLEDWFPNHCLVLHVLLLFSVLNPFVLPFGTLYFFVQTGVMKNQVHPSFLLSLFLIVNGSSFQFIHVYSKNFEGDGKILLIRIVRYSLDGQSSTTEIFVCRSNTYTFRSGPFTSHFLGIYGCFAKISECWYGGFPDCFYRSRENNVRPPLRDLLI